jgi:hypothetical protein
MRSLPQQLSFVEAATVVVKYDPLHQPPDATGPHEWGSFEATLQCQQPLSGQGRTERLALTALAERLHDCVAGRRVRAGLTALDQALVAAQRMTVDELAGWLERRAGEPVLIEP